MKRIVEFETEHGSVAIEVSADGGDGAIERASSGATQPRSTDLDRALSGVRPAIDSIFRALRDAQPDQMEVEFGLKFTAKHGAVIAAPDSDATMKLVLRWQATKV